MKSAYEIGGTISIRDDIDPDVPRRKNGVRAAAHLGASRPRAQRGSNHMDRLSEKMKAGLCTLLAEGEVEHQLQFWRGAKGGEIRRETIEALFDRYMVAVTTEIEPKRRHVAHLTEIGRLVAERLAQAKTDESADQSISTVSEQASRLIAALVDDFDSSPNVYPEEEEAL